MNHKSYGFGFWDDASGCGGEGLFNVNEFVGVEK